MNPNYFRTVILTALIGLSCMNVRSQIAISSAEDLQKIGNDASYPMSGSYCLTADIDLAGIADWIPIGATSVTDANPVAFTGVLDGSGFAVKNLKITTQTDFKGLFGTLTNATIKNLTMEVNIKGNNQVGAVTGSMQGETLIERVSVKGNIEGVTNNTGGITGRVQTDATHSSYNVIRNCYINAGIKSQAQAGGIAGRANGSLLVEKVYVAGKIEAAQSAIAQNAAGIVACITYNLIRFISSVVAVDEIKGGSPNFFYSSDATRTERRYLEYFEDLYARNDISLQYYSTADKGTGAEIVNSKMLLAPEHFKQQSFYTDTLLWDFENVWTMGEAGYPELRTGTNAEIVREKEKIKVACIGNSITENAALSYYDKYPSRLQELLGKTDYAVRNYGTGGTCMLKNGSNSYWALPRLAAVLNWKPDILVIKLGTNDTSDANWPLIADFKNDYLAFIDTFKTANPEVEIYVCHPVPVFNNDTKDENVRGLGVIINEIAEEEDVTFVDLYTPLTGKSSLYYDNLHPGAGGTKIMANILYNAITKTSDTEPRIVYASPTGTGSGNSWEDAADFSSAVQLARNIENHQIWLKEGTYLFTAPENLDGLFIYGGFNGSEDDLDERNWHTFPVILDGNDQVSPLRNRTTTTGDSIPSLLDGVIIQNGLNPSAENGGGILTNNGTVLRNCIFRNNQTQNAKNGAAIHCHIGTTVIENCLFVNNTSSGNGGAVQIGGGSKAVLINSTFANNKATGLGGALGAGAATSHCTLINTLAYNNLSNGSVYNSYAQNANLDGGGDIISIHSAIESTSAKFSDGNDINHISLSRIASPGFSAASQIIGKASNASETEAANSASYALAAGSICIDAGKSDEVSGILLDIAGENRIQGGSVDIGAYEFNSIQTGLFPALSVRNITAFVAGNELYIAGVEKGKQLDLLDIKGSLLYSQRVAGESEYVVIRLKQRGVYLVKVDNDIVKIIY